MSDKGKAGRVSDRLLCLSALVFSSLPLASACGSKTQPTQQPTAAYVRLVSSEHGFSLEYPSSYKSADVSPSERPSGALYMRQWWTGTTTSPVYMWVVVNPPSAWGNGADAKLVLRTMRKMYGAGKGERPEETNVKLRAARLTTVAGLPAAYSERSYTEDGETVDVR